MSITLWPLVHAERAALLADLEGLDDAQWHEPSLCPGWDVEHVVAHLTAAASTGRVAWMRSIVASRFRPAVHNDRRLRAHLGATPSKTLDRYRAAVGLRIAPTKDVAAYLGEVIVHAADIRVPLRLATRPSLEAATAVARFYVSRDVTVPSRTLARGLRLRATDGPFEHGEGPLVEGPTDALVLSLAGRAGLMDRLDGDGVALLGQRLAAV